MSRLLKIANELLTKFDPDTSFLTGSVAFGTETKGSDIDIAVEISEKDRVEETLKTLGAIDFKDSDYNAGFKCQFCLDSATINIVPLHPLDFLCWKLTTKHLKELCEIEPEIRARISNRTVKLGTFEILTGFHKTLLSYTGSEKTLEVAKKVAL